MKKPLYQQIAIAFGAYLNCINRDVQNAMAIEWQNRHYEKIESLCKEYLPSGSGFDSGTQFDFDKSRVNRLVFIADFHHMNENGYYDGWTQHSVIVTPCLQSGFDMRITGKDRRGIKEYIADTFAPILRQ